MAKRERENGRKKQYFGKKMRDKEEEEEEMRKLMRIERLEEGKRMKTEDGKGGCGMEQSKANREDVREKEKGEKEKEFGF